MANINDPNLFNNFNEGWENYTIHERKINDIPSVSTGERKIGKKARRKMPAAVIRAARQPAIKSTPKNASNATKSYLDDPNSPYVGMTPHEAYLAIQQSMRNPWTGSYGGSIG